MLDHIYHHVLVDNKAAIGCVNAGPHIEKSLDTDIAQSSLENHYIS